MSDLFLVRDLQNTEPEHQSSRIEIIVASNVPCIREHVCRGCEHAMQNGMTKEESVLSGKDNDGKFYTVCLKGVHIPSGNSITKVDLDKYLEDVMNSPAVQIPTRTCIKP